MNKITKLEIGKRNKERVNVYIDEEFSFSVSAELIYKQNLKVKDTVDIEDLKRLVEEDNYIKCKNSALRIIEKTFKTEKEMRDKLSLKGYDNHIIDKTIIFLKDYNFINDENYARMFVKDKSSSQGVKKIKYTLLQKGIKNEIIETELSNLDFNDMKELALEQAYKKFKIISKRENDKYKLSQKLYRFLVSKGYDYNLVSEIVKTVVKSEEL